jgi:hypothetical protein
VTRPLALFAFTETHAPRRFFLSHLLPFSTQKKEEEKFFTREEEKKFLRWAATPLFFFLPPPLPLAQLGKRKDHERGEKRKNYNELIRNLFSLPPPPSLSTVLRRLCLFFSPHVMATRFEIVTYNLLSEKYGTPAGALSKAVLADDPSPAWMTIDDRWRRVRDKLAAKVAPDVRAIICLQETSLEWTMRLVPFFAKHNYALVYDNFSRPNSGYMVGGSPRLRVARAALVVPVERTSTSTSRPYTPKRGKELRLFYSILIRVQITSVLILV